MLPAHGGTWNIAAPCVSSPAGSVAYGDVLETISMIQRSIASWMAFYSTNQGRNSAERQRTIRRHFCPLPSSGDVQRHAIRAYWSENRTMLHPGRLRAGKIIIEVFLPADN